MAAISIKRANIADKHILIDLVQRQFKEHQIERTLSELQTAINVMLSKDGLGFFMLARRGNQVIGFAAISFAWTLEHGGKTAWLDELYVIPEQRNLGVGSVLVDAVITATQQAGCLAIDLEVEADHSRAEHLYARKGFESLSRRRWVRVL